MVPFSTEITKFSKRLQKCQNYTLSKSYILLLKKRFYYYRSCILTIIKTNSQVSYLFLVEEATILISLKAIKIVNLTTKKVPQKINLLGNFLIACYSLKHRGT